MFLPFVKPLRPVGLPRLLNETYLCVTRLQMDPLYYRTALADTCKLDRCRPVLRSEMEGRHVHIDVEGTLARRDNWCSGLMLPSVLHVHEKKKLNQEVHVRPGWTNEGTKRDPPHGFAREEQPDKKKLR